ncbi:SCO-spondin-like isoform X4 [Ostrinia furnacalis]|uniref:SCO-spondin-like isoform X4 n=1 Tax=Ostrinia furnacalis TaxID=93504 RepID=UPI00103E367E|nr:SCO-spondin-like isoform X4 [Ostrinia furnacalis]
MKCVILAGFLMTLLGHGCGNVLRCSLEGTDAACSNDDEKVQSPVEVEEKPERQTECLAGSEWESNCHYCRCADSGVAECLKQEACDSGVFSEPINCKPNTTFERECNTCVCLENGLALCTIQYCRRSAAPKKSELPTGKECAPGSTWRSRCNDCKCIASGYAACTEAACVEQDAKPEIRCAPNTMWQNDCNTCWCSAEGRAMCTKVGCVSFADVKVEEIADDQDFISESNTSLVRTARAAQEAPYKACQPGQEFRLDCNKCLCDNSGQDFSCTRIDCNAPNNDGARTKRETSNLVEVSAECTAGSTFEQGCNTCKCTADGRHAMCTNKKCVQENQISTDVHGSDAADPGFRCNPGEQFKKDCNDCTCSADGRSTFCTLRLCDQDITSGL